MKSVGRGRRRQAGGSPGRSLLPASACPLPQPLWPGLHPWLLLILPTLRMLASASLTVAPPVPTPDLVSCLLFASVLFSLISLLSLPLAP